MTPWSIGPVNVDYQEISRVRTKDRQLAAKRLSRCGGWVRGQAVGERPNQHGRSHFPKAAQALAFGESKLAVEQRHHLIYRKLPVSFLPHANKGRYIWRQYEAAFVVSEASARGIPLVGRGGGCGAVASREPGSRRPADLRLVLRRTSRAAMT